MEMIRAGQQLSLRGVSGLKGSWLRVSSCDLENRKASTENRRSTGTRSAVRQPADIDRLRKGRSNRDEPATITVA